eukprot:TRINITY_DN50955_c0_g1_i1.p1 TRINITY_DN50955_c0_g1~~TRINITY_DN50955_c0_g1_i1.p1  ORF type:complete len:316 (+),score=84.48 TRINITY_DN50955_c0_g1_i1:79-1026(+)
MIRRPPRSTLSSSSAASDVYKRQLASIQRFPVREIFQQPMCPYIRTVMRNMRESEDKFMVPAVVPSTHNIGTMNRELFVSFLVDVQERLLLSSVTLSLAMNYVDRYMMVIPVHVSKLVILGVSSLFLASKMWEVDRVPLAVFLEVTDNTCTRTEVQEMEQDMLRSLNFKMSSPTILTHLDFIGSTLLSQMPLEDSTVLHFAHYLSELSYLERKFLTYSPSVMAASAVYVALEFLNRPVMDKIEQNWTFSGEILKHHPDEVTDCMHELQSQLHEVSRSGCEALKRKFGTVMYSAVSELFDLDPACLLYTSPSPRDS